MFNLKQIANILQQNQLFLIFSLLLVLSNVVLSSFVFLVRKIFINTDL